MGSNRVVMQYIIRDYKVKVLPKNPQPNARYYIQNGYGTNIDEYVTDKEGIYHKVNSPLSHSPINWMDLVRGYKVPPTFITNILDGDVYEYTYSTSGADLTYYRLIPSGALDDSFWSDFSSNTLSGLITNKKIII